MFLEEWTAAGGQAHVLALLTGPGTAVMPGGYFLLSPRTTRRVFQKELGGEELVSLADVHSYEAFPTAAILRALITRGKK